MIKPISDLPAHADIQPLGNYIENEKHIITARNNETSTLYKVRRLGFPMCCSVPLGKVLPVI